MYVNHKAVKNTILDQIEENDIKKKVDKLHDMKLGQEMAKDAIDKLEYEEEFFRQKKKKAAEAMKKQWDE